MNNCLTCQTNGVKSCDVSFPSHASLEDNELHRERDSSDLVDVACWRAQEHRKYSTKRITLCLGWQCTSS